MSMYESKRRVRESNGRVRERERHTKKNSWRKKGRLNDGLQWVNGWWGKCAPTASTELVGDTALHCVSRCVSVYRIPVSLGDRMDIYLLEQWTTCWTGQLGWDTMGKSGFFLNETQCEKSLFGCCRCVFDERETRNT